MVLSVLPCRTVDFVAIATRDGCPADFVVAGLVVRVFWCFGARYLPRFMRVAGLGVPLFRDFSFSFLQALDMCPLALQNLQQSLSLSVLHSFAAWSFLLHLQHCFVLVVCAFWFFFQFFLLELTSMARLLEAVALSYTSATSLSFSQVSLSA